MATDRDDARERMGTDDVISYALDNLPPGYTVSVSLARDRRGGDVSLMRGDVVVPFACPLGLCDGILAAVDHARRLEGLPD